MPVALLLGTGKGVFLAESDANRRSWEIRGPLASGTWTFFHVSFAGPATITAGGASNWYGPAVWLSRDLGRSWTHSSEGLTFGDEAPEITQVRCVAWARASSGRRSLYAGVEPAGLFRSDDDGATWRRVAGHSDWPTAGAGSRLHAIIPHPLDPLRMWVAVSAGGVYRTSDGGLSWVRCVGAGDDRAGEISSTRHPLAPSLAIAGECEIAAEVRLFQTNHDGVYRSDDGGVSWLNVSDGLPSRPGFSLAVSPCDSGKIYVAPRESDQPGDRGGQMAVWRSLDGGAHWHAFSDGLPGEETFFCVQPGALAIDALEPAGVYLGTTTGRVYWSADEGETWQEMAARLPAIHSLAVMTVPQDDRKEQTP